MEVKELRISEIITDGTNVRMHIGDLSELTESIREHGVLQPILVRPKNGKYEIVAGLRRFEASKLAGMKLIPSVVREMTDHEAIVASLAENLQRNNMEVDEIGSAFEHLDKIIPDYTKKKFSQDINRSELWTRDVLSGWEFLKRLRELEPEMLKKEFSTNYLVDVGTLINSAINDAYVRKMIPSEKDRNVIMLELVEKTHSMIRAKAIEVVDRFRTHPNEAVDKLIEYVDSIQKVITDISTEQKAHIETLIEHEGIKATVEQVLPDIIKEGLKEYEEHIEIKEKAPDMVKKALDAGTITYEQVRDYIEILPALDDERLRMFVEEFTVRKAREEQEDEIGMELDKSSLEIGTPEVTFREEVSADQKRLRVFTDIWERLKWLSWANVLQIIDEILRGQAKNSLVESGVRIDQILEDVEKQERMRSKV